MGRLSWDGQTLQAELPPAWPQRLDTARMLSDLQLALWPLAPLQSHLPGGWSLEDATGSRQLRRLGDLMISVEGAQSMHLSMTNHKDRYRLQIDSMDLETPHAA